MSSSGEKEYEKQTNKKNIFGTDLIICSDTGGESKAQHWFKLKNTKDSLLSRVAKHHGPDKYVCVKKSPEEKLLSMIDNEGTTCVHSNCVKTFCNYSSLQNKSNEYLIWTTHLIMIYVDSARKKIEAL